MPTLAVDTEHLSELRSAQGLDMDKDLARAMGVHKGTISRVVRGLSAPGPAFVAAALLTFPVKFEEIFIVLDEGTGVVVTADEERSPRETGVAA